MVGHYDGVVDNKVQRNCDAGERIQLQLHIQKIINQAGDSQINYQTERYHKHLP